MAAEIVACPACGAKNRVPAAAKGVPHCGRCGSGVPWVAEAGDDTFAAVVEQSKLPVLVDLWAPWCGPCRSVSPVLERLAETHAGKLKLAKINVDESPRLSQRFGVQSIPMLLLMRGGELVARRVGAAPEHVLAAWLEETFAS
ncbi:MAG TPA: thioredoxin [Actinomycetota bacterium]|nr:thioredoxin [Actinomycetota bacterium]